MMKKLFYIGVILLTVFEILNVYFIMPMPGSQKMNSIDVAYFLYSYRWFFRLGFILLTIAGAYDAFSIKRKLIPVLTLIPVISVVYIFNFQMTADQMFLQPETLTFQSRAESTLNDSSIVVAVTRGGDSRAYPIRYIQYHHQVRDSIGGMPIMVTYCNVCRTGRVFEPVVEGKTETFRLVGMDHFNAMFEDETTGSWWRQATGEAITGPLKGNALPEVESDQLTLGKFFSLHPFGKVMQAEARSMSYYDTLGRFEKGQSKSKLTRTDTSAWKEKSWVVGVQIDDNSKAYDWQQLKKLRILNDKLGDVPIVIALASDAQSFAVFRRVNNEPFTFNNDSLVSAQVTYDLHGRSVHGNRLQRVKAYQEFWHSWKEFHPNTEVYR